jgi:hypothetical protein
MPHFELAVSDQTLLRSRIMSEEIAVTLVDDLTKPEGLAQIEESTDFLKMTTKTVHQGNDRFESTQSASSDTQSPQSYIELGEQG